MYRLLFGFTALLATAALASNQSITLQPGDTVTITAPATSPVVVPPTPAPVPTPSPIPVPPDTSCASNYTRLDWNGTALERRGYTEHFGQDGIWTIEFTTGPVATTPGNLPKITAAEYQSPPSTRVAVLSDKPCDFSGAALGLGSTSISNSVTIVFSIGTPAGFFTPTLKPNSTYYFNVKNSTNSSCNVECSMFVDLIKPGGL